MTLFTESKHPLDRLFKPRDRYFYNQQGWFYYTANGIGGPFKSKSECVDACCQHIQEEFKNSPAKTKT